MTWNFHCTLFLAFLVLVNVAVPTFSLPKSEFCTPHQPTKGDKQSTVLVVKEYSRAASDFQLYPAKPLRRSTSYKLQNDGKVVDVIANVRARFSGGSVCLSAVRLSVTDDGGVNEKKEFTCERVCLDTSGQVQKLMLNSTEGGRVWPGRHGGLCCVWATERYLLLSLQRPRYECVTCRGNECRRTHVGSKQCLPGARCFSLTLQRSTSPNKVSPLYSGCTSDSTFSGYSCWNDCRRSVRVAGSTVKSQVCLHCCTGNSCNKNYNVTLVNTTAPPVGERIGNYPAHGRAGAPLCVSLPLTLFVVSALFILKYGH